MGTLADPPDVPRHPRVLIFAALVGSCACSATVDGAVGRHQDERQEPGYVVAAHRTHLEGRSPSVLVADPRDSSHLDESGGVWLVDVRTGEQLAAQRGSRVGERFGDRLEAVGDVDGDGRADFLASGSPAHRGTRLTVISGEDGSILREWRGAAIGAAGDVDGDGRADVLLGETTDATDPTAVGRNLVLSGRDGSEILELESTRGGSYYARRLGSVGDVDGDGSPELFVLGKGTVWVHSGATGAVVRCFAGGTGREIRAVAGGGDFDRDGACDLVLAVWSGRTTWLEVRSVRDGSTLLGTEEVARFPLRCDALAPGDLDGDGVGDLVLVGEQKEDHSTSRAYSGADGAPLFALEVLPRSWFTRACYVSSSADVDGDGSPELLLGYVNSGRSGAPFASGVLLCSGRTGAILRPVRRCGPSSDG